ncbi:formyltetrahydrofolate deformylase [Pyruvatibacter mobilis]|uniref:formyltetrahydrofolate deformylase n=1 Tax=Pyruvatibacter mobilis TaxID=1712261 RepID=UPI0003FE2D75
MTDPSFALTLSCPNKPGIVMKVSALIYEAGGDIVTAQQFDDTLENRFFMRVVFRCATGKMDVPALRALLATLGDELEADWQLRDRSQPRKVMILVSKFDHCLADLLYRWRRGEQAMDITAIVSNHPRETFNGLDLSGLRFEYLPSTKETKPQQEQKLWSLIEETGTELVVLARYMQVLSDDLSARLAGRCINIHHSFLPSFKGARPYHQAHARGVKVIGATAHYVTADLDEGPIIAQDVEPISHGDTPEDLIRRGRDIERRVLAKAVRHHLDDRILLNGSRTVVFD